MGIPRFFKLPSNKRFEYKPLYYDEQKEELQERVREIELEMGVMQDNYKPTISRGKMRGYVNRSKKQKKQSNIRLLIILFFLFAIAYYVFYYNPS